VKISSRLSLSAFTLERICYQGARWRLNSTFTLGIENGKAARGDIKEGKESGENKNFVDSRYRTLFDFTLLAFV
jgi:hypothetical protein